MKRIAIVLAGLLLCCSSSVFAAGKRASARRPPAQNAAGANLYCPTTSDAGYAQFAPDAQKGCVSIHSDHKVRARVFADASAFANVCPIVIEDFSTDAGCLSGMRLPDIRSGDRIHLDYFNGSYQLTIVGASGALVSRVALTPHHVQLGSGAEEVTGYAWLQGTDGGLVYYAYMDDLRDDANAPDMNRHYVVDVYVAGNETCRAETPDVSAVALATCAPPASPEPPVISQGGTTPGGEPPPTKKP